MRIGKRWGAALTLIGAVALVVFVTASGALTNTTATLVDAKNRTETVSGNPQAVPPGAVVDIRVDTTLGSGADNFKSIRYRVDGGAFSTCNNGPDYDSSGSVTYYVNDVTLPEAPGSHTIDLELFSGDDCAGTKTTATRDFTTKTPSANPDLSNKCDLKVALVLDESASIGNSAPSVRAAATAFANGLVGSGSQIGVIEFNTSARVVDLDAGGSAFYNAVTQSWVNTQLTPYLTNNYSPGDWTNWQDALQKVLDQANPDLVVYITDGDPTARNPAPDTSFPEGSYSVLNPALANADLVRADGTHMFVVGVGNGLSSGSSQARLRAISGPDQYPAQSDIFKADYTLVTDFSDLQNALADLARSLCSVRVKVQKLVDNVGDGTSYAAENGWTFDGSVTVSGASNDAYRWLAPGTVTGPPSGGNTRTATTATTTDGVGYAEFAWLPNPTTLTSQVVLTDTGKPGFHYADVTCTKNGQALAVTAGRTITIGGLVKQDTVVCTYKNQKDAGRVKVVKQFTGTPATVGLQVDGQTKTIQSDATFDTGWVNVTPGQHSVGEVFANGADAALYESSYQCGTLPVGSGTSATVSLTTGQDLVCTFFNKRKPELTVVKVVQGGAGETFNLFVDGAEVAHQVGNNGSGSKTFSGPGTVSVSETFGDGSPVGAGWSVTYSGACDGTPSVTLGWGDDKTCTITNSRNTGLLKVKKVILSNANEDSRFDLAVDGLPVPGLNDVAYPGGEATVELPTGSHTVSETFGNGATVSSDWVVQWSDNCPNGVATVVKGSDPTVCTVTNKRKPKLTVTKNVVGSTQQFDILDGVAKLFTSSGASTSQTFTFGTEGSHPISETLAGGGAVGSAWDVAWVGDCAGAGHTVSLAWGDAKACTITNTKLPTLTITKNIVGTGADASFDVFDGVGQAAVLDNASQSTQSVTKGYAVGAAVNVTETTGDGVTPIDTNAWTAVKSGDCTVTLAAGDEKTCTITNKRRPAVLVQKVVVGGTAKPGDFTIGITATNPDKQSVTGSTAGTVVTVDPGTFQAVETNPSPLYTVSYSAGCGPVGVDFGDAQRTCTVTNTRKPYGISVTKTARDTEVAEPGETVTFDVVVHNDSATDTVTITTLTDDPAGPAGATSLHGVGTCTLPQQIAPGVEYTCSFPLAISGNAGEAKVDVVAASGTNAEGSPVSDDDDAVVTLTDVAPSIVVTKAPDKATLPEPGGDVVFAVTVKNTSVSSDPVTLTSLVDSVFGNLVDDAGNAQISESTCVLGTIAPGATYECSFKAQVVGNAGLVHEDTVTAKGHDDDLPNPDDEVTGSATATVTLTDVAPSIVVTKAPDKATLPEPGGDVVFAVTVKNTSVSSDPVTLTSLVDSVFGNLVDDAGNAQISESTCVLGTIAPGATYECSFKAQVVGNAGLVHEDTVTAKGHDDDLPNPDDEVTGSATATVTLTDVAPSIVVTKAPDKATLPEPGGDVVFAVTVKNTSVSSDPVTLTSLVDSVFGNLVDDAGNAQISESTCVLGTIAPGAAYECSFKAQVVGNAGLVHEDTVTAKGHDDDLPNPVDEVTGSATATVTLTDVDSTIEVTKTPSPSRCRSRAVTSPSR